MPETDPKNAPTNDDKPEDKPNDKPTGPGDPPADDKSLGETGERALRAERDARKAAERQTADLRSKVEQLEAASLSDLEKAQRRAERAEKELADSQLSSLRQRVALDKGLPASLVGRLQGTTEDELSKDADELLGLVKTSPTTPKPDPSQGSRGGDPRTSTADQFAETVGGLFT